MKKLRIDIAAGEHCHRDLALHADLSREQRGKRGCTAGLNHELELAEGKRDCGTDFRIAYCGAFSHQFAINRECELARRLRHQRIADGARQCRILLALAAAKGASVIINPFGPRRIETRAWPPRLYGECNSSR